MKTCIKNTTPAEIRRIIQSQGKTGVPKSGSLWMALTLISFFLIVLFPCRGSSQNVIIKGKIRCINQNENSTKGAENIIVVPTFLPSRATITASRPSGYFEFNTGVPLSKLQDKIVTVYAVSRCAGCREISKRVFISEDQDRQNRDDSKRYVTIKDWMLNANCQQAEFFPVSADSLLNVIIKQPEQNLDKVSAATALTGAPAFLNFLSTITPVVGVLPNAGTFEIQRLLPGKISYGQFLMSSPLSQSANTGFNFSPSRDMSEAMFWNPSAITQSRKPNNISLLTNLKNNVKFGGFYKLNDKISLSAGGIYTVQDERRKSVFVRTPVNDPNDILNVDSTKMKLKEYAAFLSPVYKVNDELSFGITLKSIWQDFNIPNTLFVEFIDVSGIGTFTNRQITRQRFDVDLSATYKVSKALQAGINLMNLAGTELYADAFVQGQPDIPVQQQRSLGLGLTYKWQRLNVGTDVLMTADGLFDAAFGANYVPFNHALISAGMAVKQLSYSFAFRIKHFRIAYIYDNDFLVNERRKGKSPVLNGRIYGGFVFDLN